MILPVAGMGRLASFLILALVFPTGLAAQQMYRVDLAGERLVRFVSSTTLDEFDGVTERIDGYALLDTPSLSSSTGEGDTELYFEVDLASIDTGIGLRNRHMRDNYLHVRDYPYATFLGEIASVEPMDDGAFRVTASGTMSIHGVDRPMRVPCEVSPWGRGYRARCAFQVMLTDFNIEIPRVMFMKLANEIRLELDFPLAPEERAP